MRRSTRRSRIAATGVFVSAAVVVVSGTLLASPVSADPGTGAAAAAAGAGRVRVGGVSPVPAGAQSAGLLPATSNLRVDVVLQPQDPAALEGFVTAVSTPGSSSYRHYLRPGSFATRFGATPATIANVEASLKSQGLRLLSVSPNRLSIEMQAPASTASRVFGVRLSRFRLRGGRVAYANTTAPTLAGPIGHDVQTVLGLDDLNPMVPEGLEEARSASPTAPDTATAITTADEEPDVTTPAPCAGAQAVGNGAYTADKLAAAYGFTSLYSGSDFGSGETVALYELERFNAVDISTFQSCYGTSTTVNSGGTYKIDGGATGNGFGSGEAALDIEDVIGLAPGATIDVYQGPNNTTGPYDTYNAIVSQDKAQVVSTSWGLCEAQLGFGGTDEADAESVLFAEAATQGQTVLAATGDEGSEACYNSPQGTTDSNLAVSDPAAQPDVTAVGGTSLTLNSSNQRTGEVVWNDGVSGGAGGGGVSSFWQMPTWQSGAPASLNVVESGYSSGCSSGAASYTLCRQVPDVSADADEYTGYVVYYCGTCSGSGPNGWQAIGGTSAAAPLWAARGRGRCRQRLFGDRGPGALEPRPLWRGGQFGLLQRVLRFPIGEQRSRGARRRL